MKDIMFNNFHKKGSSSEQQDSCNLEWNSCGIRVTEKFRVTRTIFGIPVK